MLQSTYKGVDLLLTIFGFLRSSIQWGELQNRGIEKTLNDRLNFFHDSIDHSIFGYACSSSHGSPDGF